MIVSACCREGPRQRAKFANGTAKICSCMETRKSSSGSSRRMKTKTKELILVRTRTLDEHTIEFGEQLKESSGSDVCFVVDERHKQAPSTDKQIISLNAETYRELGLFTPWDAAWRCGDYGIYMAWRTM